ncbi:leucine-rich repeat-containing protein 14-like [Sinocyclocheilus grahami]|uniref:leucine-rich repeat-containing protein 14-like n=1 Tax=Sinocyclocheilus grahami TaxID=75366 RepID=UPI0007AD00E2|nr:PREDICTED: leucine-rich repeat-containing protein 14-like [Sinocyclocheilus grahami]
MVLSLVNLCAREVVSDHSSSPYWLSCVPRELYRALLDAAFTHCRPLAVGELVQRWPERTLTVGGSRKAGECPPNRLCVQALLLAVVRGLTDKRCCLQMLDLSGLQCENGRVEDSMGGWSLSVALCSMVLQARAAASRAHRRDGERERKRGLEAERDRGTIKRDRGKVGCGNSGEGSQGGHGVEEVEKMECKTNERMLPEDESVKGVRRRMEIQRRKTISEGKSNTSSNSSRLCDQDWDEVVVVHVRADLFVNSRSWERVRDALSQPGPLQLHCHYLRVEELSAPSIASLLGLLPQQNLLGVDIRYSSLGVSGLAMLLPLLAPFPQLHSLRLHYCNLDLQRTQPGQQGALQDMSKGLGSLKKLKRLCLTALRLPGHLRLLLRSSLPSLRRLLAQAENSLCQLSLCGCGLSDSLLSALLPSLSSCQALRRLRLALNPLSRTGLLCLARTAAGIPSLRLLLYPNPLEEYEPGLPALPSSAQLLDWPLLEESEGRDLTLRLLEEVLNLRGRSRDLLVTSDLLNYSPDLTVDE